MRIFLSLLFIAFAHSISAQHSLRGKITNKNNGESIPGVAIYLPELKSGVVSGVDGTYLLTNLPGSKLVVQHSILGFKQISEAVEFRNDSIRNFMLEPSITEIKEFIVTGISHATERNRVPTPVTSMQSKQIQQLLEFGR